jgi:hypothetical protein
VVPAVGARSVSSRRPIRREASGMSHVASSSSRSSARLTSTRRNAAAASSAFGRPARADRARRPHTALPALPLCAGNRPKVRARCRRSSPSCASANLMIRPLAERTPLVRPHFVERDTGACGYAAALPARELSRPVRSTPRRSHWKGSPNCGPCSRCEWCFGR